MLIVLISAVDRPRLGLNWLDLLADSIGANMVVREPFVPIPLYVRMPMAALLIAWGARTDRYWTVPIGVMLSLPGIGLSGFAVAVGALAFTRLPFIPRWWWPESARTDLRAAKRSGQDVPEPGAA